MALAWFKVTSPAGFTWPASPERADPVQASASEAGAIRRGQPEAPEQQAVGPDVLEVAWAGVASGAVP